MDNKTGGYFSFELNFKIFEDFIAFSEEMAIFSMKHYV
jgi:hypothetical protein